MAKRNTCWDLFLIVLSIVLPPVPVAFKRGFCSADFLINIALCILGFLPGLIHAWYIIAKYPQDADIDDIEAHRSLLANEHGHGHSHNYHGHSHSQNQG
ncbi:Plasma membrane proteolipid 31 [Wickerhamiella sorbophila]|uniref:Plasma membrane proteolipid 31 n=1 Tax=Wickerhamiella sorbophila TaxID=45607 RepID=A0A2T0FPJ8_9ASCO|nr:Plasma membrane proteolipid 31 [Wickerhamiella sorbophila]PRT56914.1 Plasma membrane proteolipid 31 [Wickerhamiella sorbophila]